MKNLLSYLRLPLFFVGLIVLFVSERYFTAEKFHAALLATALGLSFLGTAATALAAVLAGRERLDGETRSWWYAFAWQVGALVGAGLYLIYLQRIGGGAAADAFYIKAMLASALVVLILSFASGVGIEISLRECGKGSMAEPVRVCRSGITWLLVGMLLATLVCLNYAGAKRDRSFDWSYLKTTKPGTATQNMLKTLTEPIKVAAFYPETNEVRPFLEEYLKNLSRLEKKIEVTFYDKELNPKKAEEYRVSANGQVVFDLKGKQEKLEVGTTIASARQTLRNFDARFQKVFLALTSKSKAIYFSRGHGESSWIVAGAEPDPQKSLRIFEAVLRDMNYSLHFFGVSEGSTTAVPDEAAAVAIVGPNKPFLPEETAALKTYLDKGGKLMIFLEKPSQDEESKALKVTGNDDPLRALLESIGLTFNEGPLANDRNFVAATRSPADAWFLFSNSFTSHESVASLARHEERVAVLFFDAGYWTVAPQQGKWKASETVRTLPDTFVDVNRNFVFDKESEKRASYPVGAVATMSVDQPKPADKKDEKKKDEERNEARVMAFADATAASDALMRNPGNMLFIADTLKWMVGESAMAGETTTEEDVKIQHTRKEDLAYFYGSVALFPVLVLGAGFIATRRKRPRKTDKNDPPASEPGVMEG